MSIISCGPKAPKELTTPGGYKYTHVKTDGQKAQPGDFVYFTFTMKGSDGTTLQEMGEGPNMPSLQIPKEDQPNLRPNPFVDILTTAALNDSIKLIMPIDSLPNKNNPQLAGMEYLEYYMYVTKINDEVAQKAEMEALRLEQEKEMEAGKARMAEVAANTEQIIKDYNAGKLDVQSTEDGLKYVIHEQGDGDFAEAGKRATVHYYGAFMDGKMFDSSFRMGRPYTLTVGRGEVIQGWDKGIPLLKKGAKASLFIPYTLAYGEAGNPPNIPEKTDLMFYVELVDVQ